MQRMLREATTVADFEAAFRYGEKVDAFGATGVVTLTELEYEGPDLSAGADRENSMKGGVSKGYSASGSRKGFGTPPPEDAGFGPNRLPVPRQWSRSRGEVVNT